MAQWSSVSADIRCPTSGSERSRFLLKMMRRDPASWQAAEIIEDLLEPPVCHPVGSILVPEGARPRASLLLKAGFCAKVSHLPDGRRQFTQLNVPGDFVDLHSLATGRMDHGVVALSECITMAVPHRRMRDAILQDARVGDLLWLDSIIDGAMHREWLLAFGRRNAMETVSLLICELYTRLEAVELTHGGSIRMPLTQALAADLVGLSAVHLNRIVMEMRHRGWISWCASNIDVHDLVALANTADFDPAYLGLAATPS